MHTKRRHQGTDLGQVKELSTISLRHQEATHTLVSPMPRKRQYRMRLSSNITRRQSHAKAFQELHGTGIPMQGCQDRELPPEELTPEERDRTHRSDRRQESTTTRQLPPTRPWSSNTSSMRKKPEARKAKLLRSRFRRCSRKRVPVMQSWTPKNSNADESWRKTKCRRPERQWKQRSSEWPKWTC